MMRHVSVFITLLCVVDVNYLVDLGTVIRD